MIALEIVGVLSLVGITGGAFRSRVRLPKEGGFQLHDVNGVGWRTGVLDLAIFGILLDQWLVLGADVRPINGLWQQDVIVTTQVCVGLFTRQDQKVFV